MFLLLLLSLSCYTTFYKLDIKPQSVKSMFMVDRLSKTYNPGHNILELYNILVRVRFTTSKTELD